jgi:D-xylose transport system substrate-binding protein
MMHLKTPRKVAATGIMLGLLAGSAPALNHIQVAGAAHQRAISGTVGFLITDFTTSARWAFDRDYVIADLKALDPGVTVKWTDAKANQTTQQTQAQSLLTAGAKVLIDVPVDSTGAGQIVKIAHANTPPVPVIAYDRLISGAPVDAYTSFDGFSVGVQQAKYLIKHVKKGGTIVSIAGSTTDNNAHLFYNGAMSVLKPLIANGTYKLGYDQFTPNWDDVKAQTEMASALTKLNNKVDGVLVANDGMAGGVIAALKAQGLAGKIPVTGQDATDAGIQQILLGNQSMTIYKPLKNLAKAASQITDVFLHGKKLSASSMISAGKVTMVNNGMTNVPSVILPVITVTKANIKSTVIADGFTTKARLCKGIPASACAGL